MSNFDFFLIVIIIIFGVIGILHEIFFKFLKILNVKTTKVINKIKRIITVTFFMKIYTVDNLEFVCAKSEKDVKEFYQNEFNNGWKIKRINNSKKVWFGIKKKDYTDVFLDKHNCIKGDKEWDLYILISFRKMIKMNNMIQPYIIYWRY